MKKKLLTLVLFCSLLFSLAACAGTGNALNLMESITPVTPARSERPVPSEFTVGQMAFSVELLRQTAAEAEGKNLLISPLSVSLALSMAANGAVGETQNQMLQILSGGLEIEEWNQALYDYTGGLLSSESARVGISNSVWFRQNRIAVRPSFLQTAADYYGAAAYEAPFDRSTVKQINRWVKENTDGMIDGIVDEIPSDAVTYLINALVFEADWRSIYYKNQVSEGVFTTADGIEQKAEMMYADLFEYIETDGATGFVKYYDGGDLYFAALLPSEGTDVSDFVASLTAEQLSGALNGVQNVKVRTKLPKFSCEYSVEMRGVLSSMGMAKAFDPSGADFSGIGTSVNGENLFLDTVLHKTYIEVAEKGTRAAAVTEVSVNDGAAPPAEDPKRVYLDRPFVYLIVDSEQNLPLFMGVLNSVKE